MKVGDALPVHFVDVDAKKIRTLATILRDPNPIHLDPLAAAAAGLGDRVINQGPANLGYIMDMVRRAFPRHRLALLQVRYLASVRAGDRVSAGGSILTIDGSSVTCEAWLRIDGGEIAVAGTLTLAAL